MGLSLRNCDSVDRRRGLLNETMDQTMVTGRAGDVSDRKRSLSERL
jgi:hypothetical protein